MTKKYEQYISLVKDPDFSEWNYGGITVTVYLITVTVYLIHIFY